VNLCGIHVHGTHQCRYKSTSAFKTRAKRKIEENLKKSASNCGQKDANDGLSYEEIKKRDLEAIQAKQKAFLEKQKLEQKGKKKK